MIQTIDFAPLDGITKIVFRQVWSQFFGGVDRYFIPFVFPSQNQYRGRFHALQRIPAGIHVGGLGIVDIIHATHTHHFLQAVFHALEITQTLPYHFILHPGDVGRDAMQ